MTEDFTKIVAEFLKKLYNTQRFIYGLLTTEIPEIKYRKHTVNRPYLLETKSSNRMQNLIN